MRRLFLGARFRQLGVVWPILSSVPVAMVGLVIGYLEGRGVGDFLYFNFVSGLTIGDGDLVPHRAASRLPEVPIGVVGIVLTGLVAAVIVQALRETVRGGTGKP